MHLSFIRESLTPFQLSIVEKSFGSTPSPRAISGARWQTHGGSSSPTAAADNVLAIGGEGPHESDDDDVVAVAALSNASAFGNDDASSGDSSGGDDDSNQASPRVASSIGPSGALDPDNDDVQRLLLQVQSARMPLVLLHAVSVPPLVSYGFCYPPS